MTRFVYSLSLLFVLASCGGSGSSAEGGSKPCEPSAGSESDLYGDWAISSIESVPSGSPLDSEFTFYSTGTYDWFFIIDIPSWKTNVRGGGNFSLDGTTLLIDGDFADTVNSGNSVEIGFCNNNRTFSFVDENGNKWTYTKI
jgi:hypothetical protein